jgi:hypothetical protein
MKNEKQQDTKTGYSIQTNGGNNFGKTTVEVE